MLFDVFKISEGRPPVKSSGQSIQSSTFEYRELTVGADGTAGDPAVLAEPRNVFMSEL